MMRENKMEEEKKEESAKAGRKMKEEEEEESDDVPESSTEDEENDKVLKIDCSVVPPQHESENIDLSVPSDLPPLPDVQQNAPSKPLPTPPEEEEEEEEEKEEEKNETDGSGDDTEEVIQWETPREEHIVE